MAIYDFNKTKTYYTREGRAIPGERVVELSDDGYVTWSTRWIIMDFSAKNDDSA